MKIVVIGGTGLIGSKVVGMLRAQGHEAVAASPATGVDTLTGEGLREALAGAQVVVDVSNSPSFEEKAVRSFFLTSTSHLSQHEIAAGVRHHVVLSIVGADRAPDSAYLAAKVAQEKLVAASPVPSTIVHSTQFFEFAKGIADGATQGNEVRIPGVLFQPIAAEDVATALARVATGAPMGTLDIAGPERFRFDEFIARALRARNDPRPVVRDDEARYFGGRLAEGTLVPSGEGAWLGEQRFEEWLRRNTRPAGEVAAATPRP